jgi:ferritin-like metal-binding protein YciE
LAVTHSMFEDELIKNDLANFAFENYEIAAYRSLLILSEQAPAKTVVSPLQTSLNEEIQDGEMGRG